MKFAEAKARKDYKYFMDDLAHYIPEIRKGRFKYHDEIDGEHIWGVAVLEIGRVDIEVNLGAYTENKNGKVLNEIHLDYFICAKDKFDEWTSVGYIDDPVAVDFNKDDWRTRLEIDMFKKLVCVVKEYGLSFDHSDRTEDELFDLFWRRKL